MAEIFLLDSDFKKKLLTKFALFLPFKIVLVTHTVPKKEYSKNLRIEVNSDYKKLFYISSKLKYWLFGHTHQQMDKKDGIRFISNPRGRPEDYNREKYSLKKISL